jgi:hypothetical protein
MENYLVLLVGYFLLSGLLFFLVVVSETGESE